MYLLTSIIEVTVQEGDEWVPHPTYGTITPGLVDGDYMRRALGARLFARAQEVGFLIPRLYGEEVREANKRGQEVNAG